MSYTWGGGGEGSYFYRGREGAKARKGRGGAACLKREIAGRRQVIDYCASVLYQETILARLQQNQMACVTLSPPRLKVVNQGTELTINC